MSTVAQSKDEIVRLRDLIFKEERQLLLEHSNKIALYDERIGTDEQFLQSISAALVDALREADRKNHDQLANTLATVIIGVVRREVLNSKEELVDALYPIMGRLVSAYMARGLQGFVVQTDRRIERALSWKNLKLRVRSAFTGTPYAELQLRRSRFLCVDEIFLIKRGGLLADHWKAANAEAEQEAAKANSDQMMVSNMLSAITDFVSDGVKQGELKSLDVGGDRIHLRATPAYIIAVRCSGSGNAILERRLDRELVLAAEEYESALSDETEKGEKKLRKSFIPKLADRLNSALLGAAIEIEQPRRLVPYYALTLVAALALGTTSLAGGTIASKFRQWALRNKVESVLSARSDLNGFPVGVSMAPDGSRIVLSGIMPSEQAAHDVAASVAHVAGDTPVSTNFVYGVTNSVLGTTLGQVQNLVVRLTDIEQQITKPLEVVAAPVLKPVNQIVASLPGTLNDTLSTFTKTGSPIATDKILTQDLSKTLIQTLRLETGDLNNLASNKALDFDSPSTGSSAFGSNSFAGAIAPQLPPLSAPLNAVGGATSALGNTVGGLTNAVGNDVKGIGGTVAGGALAPVTSTVSNATGAAGGLVNNVLQTPSRILGGGRR